MKIRQYIEKYWIFLIIITQPILDIIAYFSFDSSVTIISFVMRSIYLVFILLYTFIKSKDKKKYILLMLPFIIFSIIHLINSYRISGFNIFDDLRYLINTMQFPIITISLIDYLKYNKDSNFMVEKGLVVSYIIIFISVMISFITNSYSYTYEEYGLTGWFSSANTQSMILAILSPLFLYYTSKKSNWAYAFSTLMVFLLLYFNGTRACYYTLVLSFPVILYTLLINKKRNRYKIITTITLIFVSIILYNFSVTFSRLDDVVNNNSTYTEAQLLMDRGNLTKEETLKVLRYSYLYEDMINDLGEDVVYKEMKDKLSVDNLSNNRLVKKIYGKVIFERSDTLTKLVGINHKVISDYGKDLENDFTAIFYYYGYIGFTLYVVFILYFAYLGIKVMFIKPIKLVSPKFVIYTFTILLSLFGAEYSGALLRKSNANIYLSIVFTLYYIYLMCSHNNDNIKINMKNNKITFLLLHLGYGGIESSTINTANGLCDKYDIEIMSFYKLDKTQADKLNNKIKINYLYNGGPNKDDFITAIHSYNLFKVIKEGIKATGILIKKKYMVIKYIINCDSRYVISTRYDFSVLLSKYGNSGAIKIAQEHHYHNNDKKYINILKNKYYGIDYLFALTKKLENDYNKFLINNDHTKVILVPNMLYAIPNKESKLDKKNIITVSRLDYGKRNDAIISAFAKIEDKDYKLYIIGDGKEYDNLSNMIKELGLEDRVILTGYKNKEEIEKYMLESCLFLMASETEGLPMVLLEAMSYGLPCIAYEVASGVNDIIDNNINGYVIKNRNEDEYVEKIEEIINDFKTRKRFGKAAKDKSMEFCKEKIVNIWKKVLK